MPMRRSEATWEGTLDEGHGAMRAPHVDGDGLPYSRASRLRHGEGTNPEELLGAALAGCYSMALAHALSARGFWPKHLHTTAKVHLDEDAGKGFRISRIDLDTEGDVPAIGGVGFEEEAERTLGVCPMALALGRVPIRLTASLRGENPPRHGD